MFYAGYYLGFFCLGVDPKKSFESEKKILSGLLGGSGKFLKNHIKILPYILIAQ